MCGGEFLWEKRILMNEKKVQEAKGTVFVHLDGRITHMDNGWTGH